MKPNKRLVAAIKDYYFNRYRQYEIEAQNIGGQCLNIARRTKFVWNKDADLKIIGEVAKKQGFGGFQASAGTFWLSYRTPKGKIVTYQTDKELFPAFKKS